MLAATIVLIMVVLLVWAGTRMEKDIDDTQGISLGPRTKGERPKHSPTTSSTETTPPRETTDE